MSEKALYVTGARLVEHAQPLQHDEERDSLFDYARPNKQRITVRLDRDVLAFFRGSGKGYQTRMNAALRTYIDRDTSS